jgi:hypothetical protein
LKLSKEVVRCHFAASGQRWDANVVDEIQIVVAVEFVGFPLLLDKQFLLQRCQRN